MINILADILSRKKHLWGRRLDEQLVKNRSLRNPISFVIALRYLLFYRFDDLSKWNKFSYLIWQLILSWSFCEQTEETLVGCDISLCTYMCIKSFINIFGGNCFLLNFCDIWGSPPLSFIGKPWNGWNCSNVVRILSIKFKFSLVIGYVCGDL